MEQIGLELDGAQFDLLECKFEPERFRVEQFVLVAVHGDDVGFGGLVEARPGEEQPGLPQSLQGGEVLPS